MQSAAEVRRQVESALAERIPAALSFRPAVSPELLSCGLAEVDTALGGGLPLGGITELTGADSSGRTTLALSTLAEVTQTGESCAYVDASDSLDPFSAAALGVDLRRLLWVRAGAVDTDVASYPFSSSASTAPAGRHERVQQEKPLGGGWCHPRNETLGMDHAIGELFHGVDEKSHNSYGTASDFTPRCSESIHRKRPEPVMYMPQRAPQKIALQTLQKSFQKKPWSRLDQALRATDLILNTGGFRAIVLDMGDIRPEDARRVPLATWYRFRLQVEKSQTLFLVLTRIACANSCAAVSLHFEGAKANWHQASSVSPSLLTGLSYGVRVTRQRIDSNRKKPAASAQALWDSTASWLR